MTAQCHFRVSFRQDRTGQGRQEIACRHYDLKIIVGTDFQQFYQGIVGDNYDFAGGCFVFDEVDGDSPCSLQDTDNPSFFGTVGLSGMEQFASHLRKTDDHPQVIVYEAVLKMIDDVRFMTDVIECNAYRSAFLHIYKQ